MKSPKHAKKANKPINTIEPQAEASTSPPRALPSTEILRHQTIRELLERIFPEGTNPGDPGGSDSRCHPADIEVTSRSLEPAGQRRRVHLVIGTSRTHREDKLKMTPDQILRIAADSVRLAANTGAQVQFAAEDSTRTEPEFLDEMIDAVVEAGTIVVLLPDTLGWATPGQYAAMFRRVARRISPNIVLGAHCHNDLGLAIANSLAACQAGARQVECTLNGIGERAGNAALEEFVMALVTRADYYRMAVGVRTKSLYGACRLLTNVTGLPLARNKAVVGDNVFTTAAGIHQDGLVKNEATYQIFTPDSVGAPPARFTLSKHSGRAGVRKRLEDLSLSLTDGQFEQLFRKFMRLADKRKIVTDRDLRALAQKCLGERIPRRTQLNPKSRTK